MNSNTEFQPIFETGRPYEVLMVLNAFQEQGIPAFGQEVSVSGLVMEMPQSPAPAPGITWVVQVAQVAVEDAKAILSNLPVRGVKNPGVWDFAPNPKSKLLLQWVAGVILVLTLAGYLSKAWRLFL